MHEPRSRNVDDDDDDTPWFPAERCARLLEATATPALRSLRFDSCGFGDELVVALVGSALLRQLGELTLDDKALTPAGYEHLLARADAFRHLTRLQLRERGAGAVKSRLDAALGAIVRWE